MCLYPDTTKPRHCRFLARKWRKARNRKPTDYSPVLYPSICRISHYNERKRLFFIRYVRMRQTTELIVNITPLVFLPMAMESPLPLETITTWSSTHLAFRDPSFKATAASNRCIALKSLSNALASVDRNPEMELASCLVHCAMEKHFEGHDALVRTSRGGLQSYSLSSHHLRSRNP